MTGDQTNIGNGVPDVLTCTIQDNNSFFTHHNISWKRNGEEIITTIGNSLSLNISHPLGSKDNKFGTYSCVVSSQFGTVVETIHIAEEGEHKCIEYIEIYSIKNWPLHAIEVLALSCV